MEKNDNKDQAHELEKIRMQKMKALLEAQKRKQQFEESQTSFQDKIDYVLRAVLSLEAHSYLNNLKQKEPNVYRYIFNELVSADVIQNIDQLLAIIQHRGGVPKRIPIDVIMYLERQVKGIKSSIKVKRGDEIQDLGSYLTKKK